MKQTIFLIFWTVLGYGFSQQTDALYIDSTGKVGIGTGTPITTLQVKGDIQADSNLNVLGNLQLKGALTATSLSLSASSPTSNAIRIDAGSFSMGSASIFQIDSTGVSGGRFSVDGTGNVGIGGNANINSNLTVAGSMSLTGAFTGSSLSLSAPASSQAIRINTGSFSMGGDPTSIFQIDSVGKPGGRFSVDQYGAITIGDNLNVPNGGINVNQGAVSLYNSTGFGLYFYGSPNDNDNYVRLGLNPGGPVDSSPALYLSGSFVANCVTVSNDNCGDSQFRNAFSPQISVMPLEDLEQFVRTEQHLPGMPTEKEIQEEGMNLGEMQLKTLEKLQELTLYVLELKEENDALRERVAQLESRRN